MTVGDVMTSQDYSHMISAGKDDRYYVGPANSLRYALVGCFPNGSQNFSFAFAKKRFNTTETEGNLSTEVTLDQSTEFRIVNYGTQSVQSSGGMTLPRKPS